MRKLVRNPEDAYTVTTSVMEALEEVEEKNGKYYN